ncbi:VOC family protein [Aldersonia kunmingensis]|uniref:VOC family protein n=1 Tax=Aldersonia kunmingensis TaxID=408066 RepID=UPI00082FD619|nr:VOC family protein [Aldersonia kunmingensis]
MLDKANIFSGFSVDDTDTARKFYADTLGLSVSEQDMGLLAIDTGGGGQVLIYPKGEGHSPATFTVLNFVVSDVDSTVRELTSRGITFERYDGFEQDELGVARDPQGPAIAWFKDPCGNILSVLQE